MGTQHKLGPLTMPIARKLRPYLLAHPRSSKESIELEGVSEKELFAAIRAMVAIRAIKGEQTARNEPALYSWAHQGSIEDLASRHQTPWSSKANRIEPPMCESVAWIPLAEYFGYPVAPMKVPDGVKHTMRGSWLDNGD